MGLYLASVGKTYLFGWVMLLNMLVLMFSQPLLAKKINTFSYYQLLACSYLIFSIGVLFFTTADSLTILLGTIIMSLGQSALVLKGDIEILRQLPESPALAFGIQRLATGMGGMLAGLIGGFIFDQVQMTNNLGLFWLFVAISASSAALLAWSFTRNKKNQELLC